MNERTRGISPVLALNAVVARARASFAFHQSFYFSGRQPLERILLVRETHVPHPTLGFTRCRSHGGARSSFHLASLVLCSTSALRLARVHFVTKPRKGYRDDADEEGVLPTRNVPVRVRDVDFGPVEERGGTGADFTRRFSLGLSAFLFGVGVGVAILWRVGRARARE